MTRRKTKRFTDRQLNVIFKDWLYPPSSLKYATKDDMVPTYSPWVLRNLSQRLYVRSNELCSTNLSVEPPFTTEYGLTLADAVRQSICFTKDRRRGFYKGDCPGHRFDIVRENDFLLADGWEDVTQEVKEELERRLQVLDKKHSAPSLDVLLSFSSHCLIVAVVKYFVSPLIEYIFAFLRI